MADRPTNTIINPSGAQTSSAIEAREGLKKIGLTDEEIDSVTTGRGMPNTRMGVVLGYELEPGRSMHPGSSLTGGQPYPLQAPDTISKTWRAGDVLDYVRKLFNDSPSKYQKLAQGLLIEGYISDVADADELYELGTVLDGIGSAINEVTRRAASFGMEPYDFLADAGMDNVPTLEGMFADTDFDMFESELDRITGLATEIPDPEYLKQLFDSTSRTKAGFNLRRSNPGGFKEWLQGYRAAKEDKAERGESMSSEAYAVAGVEQIAPEAVALEKRRQYVTVANQALSSYGSA